MSDPTALPPPSLPDDGLVNDPVLERGLQPAEAQPRLMSSTRVSVQWLLGVTVIAAISLLSSVLLWQKLNNIQEELARRSTDSSSQAIEARTLARQAQEGTRELSARLAAQDARISEVSLQRTQLEELMQSLSRSRDENLVVDMESALRLAQQQAQLTGSAEPLLAALRSADLRLSRAAQPRLNLLQRSIGHDIDRIRAATLTDVPVLLMKLDELSRMADELQVANAMIPAGSSRSVLKPGAASGTSAGADSAVHVETSTATSWSAGIFNQLALSTLSELVFDGVRDEARKLLRVSRIDQPEAALLAPEQAFFLRENFKLRLLNARLGLLSRQTDTVRTDLTNASSWLSKYFDPSSRKTQAALQLMGQVQSQLKSSELPRLDETMAALATAAAGR